MRGGRLFVSSTHPKLGRGCYLMTPAFGRFRAGARHFLEEHEDHLTFRELRTNEPLTSTGLAELESMLIESGTRTDEDLEKAAMQHTSRSRGC